MRQSVLDQSFRYGRQCRQLEEQGLFEDRARVKQAWNSFIDNVPSGSLVREAIGQYLTGYGRAPLTVEYALWSEDILRIR